VNPKASKGLTSGARQMDHGFTESRGDNEYRIRDCPRRALTLDCRVNSLSFQSRVDGVFVWCFTKLVDEISNTDLGNTTSAPRGGERANFNRVFVYYFLSAGLPRNRRRGSGADRCAIYIIYIYIYVCMYIYIYIYIYTCLCLSMYLSIHIYLSIYLSISIYVSISGQPDAYRYVHIHV